MLIRYHTNEDKTAMDELVRSHMPIIFRVAGRSARNPGVDINDLVQTAVEGLLVAINRWSFEKSDASGMCRSVEPMEEVRSEPLVAGEEQGDDANTTEIPNFSRLATYAMWWMRILLTDSVISSRGVVIRAKNPKVRKALFGLPAAIKKLDLQLPLGASDVSRLSAHLGIGEREIEEALVHASGDVMLDEPVGDGSMLRGEVIPDDRAENEDGLLTRLASEERWEAICRALMELPTRDRFILITRYFLVPKWKLDRLADTLGLSRERIRQIGADSLSQIRRTINNAALAADRRRPGHLAAPRPASVPTMRGLPGPNGRATAGMVWNGPPVRSASAAVEALAEEIERAAASSDPKFLAALLEDQRIVLGPARIVNAKSQGLGTPAYRSSEVTVLETRIGSPGLRPTMSTGATLAKVRVA